MARGPGIPHGSVTFSAETSPEAVPAALAEIHAGRQPGDTVELRLSRTWQPDALTRVIEGGGFTLEGWVAGRRHLAVRVQRERTLPDFVGPDMCLLVCGLNPSLVAADAGFGYAGATNRFWPAAVAAGLVTTPRQPLRSLAEDRVGMTDLVKRATPRASEIAPAEFVAGAERVEWLVHWLRPGVILFVGLQGWRAAIDRRAVPGFQPAPFGGTPAYVMPSTSGLNARVSRAELTQHMKAALSRECR